MGIREEPHKNVSTELFEVTQHLMTCSSREGFWETLLTLLSDKCETHVSLWQKRGQSCQQVKTAPHLGASQHTIIENVFDTHSPSFISQCSVDTSTGVAKGLLLTSALALPVFEGKKLTAVLKLERAGPFGETEVNALLGLSHAVSSLLATLPESKPQFVVSGGPKS